MRMPARAIDAHGATLTRFGGRIEADCIRVGDMRIDQMDAAGLRRLRGSRVAYIA